MNKLFTRIGVAFAGIAMAIGVGVAVSSNNKNAVPASANTASTAESGYTFASMAGGTDGSDAVVIYSNGTVNDLESHDGVKVGTSSKGGTMTVTIPSGTTSLKLYAYAWNGVNDLSLSITATSGSTSATITPSSINLTSNTGIANSTPFTFKNGANVGVPQFHDIVLSGVTAQTVLTFTTSAKKRFVAWNAQTSTSSMCTVDGSGITNGSLSSTASVASGSALNVTLVPATHYHLPTALKSVTMGGNTLIAGTGYTYINDSGAISITSVTGNIVITADCVADAQYDVKYVAGENGSGTDYVDENQYEGSYTLLPFASTGLTPDSGYAFKNYRVGDVDKNPGETITLSANTTVTAIFDVKPNKARYAQSSDTVAALDTASGVDKEPTTITVTFKNDRSSDKTQMTSGEKQTWTFAGYAGYAIRSIYVSVHNNQSSGSGVANFNYDGNTISSSETLTGLGNASWTRKNVFEGMQPIATGKSFTVQLSASANSLYCNYVEIEWSEIPSLSRVDVSGTPTKATQYTGNDFDPSGLEFTAVYSDNSEIAISGSDIEWNALVASQNPTGTYGGKTVTVTTVSVLADNVDHVAATVSKDFYVGDTIQKSDVTLKQVYVSGKEVSVDSSEYTFDDYEFKYSDAPTGGSTKDSKVFSISYGGKSANLTVNVGRKAFNYAEGETKTLNTFTDLEDSYTEDQSVTINGVACNVSGYVYNSKLSLSQSKTSAPGHIYNTAALSGAISTITVSGASPDIQVKKNSTDEWSDYSAAAMINDNYYYFKLFFKTTTQSNYINISSISIVLKGTETANTLADYVMYEDTTNQCTTKTDKALTIFEGLSSSEKASFMTGTSHVISTARERLLAWTAHEEKSIDYVNGEYIVSGSNPITVFTLNNSDSSVVTIVAVIAAVSTLAIGGFFFLRKRKIG